MGRQVGGFQGRPGKAEKTCYSFWIGASLALLGVPRMLQADGLCSFCVSCQFTMGGIAKHAGAYPDVLHTYYGLCGMTLAGQMGLQSVDPRLGISARASARCGAVCAGRAVWRRVRGVR
jgi:geranylgeranyl transferase type-1 subunit beta